MKIGIISGDDEVYAQQQKMILEGMIATRCKREKLVKKQFISKWNKCK